MFHSFGEFTIGAIDTARFLNATPELLTSNILSRVTGGTPSNIFGTIDTVTEFAGANFWLINPAGVVFGPTASLNVGGSVHISTADYLRLQDPIEANAGVFSASPLVSDALTIAPVAAFGFLGSNPVGIAVQGSQLSVPTGQGISLVGGDITVQRGTLNNGTVQPARLSAPGGKINLASVASPGEILAGTLEQAQNVNGQSFGALGTIQVSQQSVIDASGDGGGTVVIRGGRFVLNNSTISANTSGPAVGESGEGINIVVAQDAVIENGAVLETNVSGNATPGVQYGGVTVKADRIEILGSEDFENFPFTGILSDVAPGSTGGSSGNIALEANSIRIKDLGTFTTLAEALTEGDGKAGDISLWTSGNLEIDGGTIFAASAFSSADAGNIELTSTHGNISMINESSVSSQTIQSSGNSGTIKVSASGGDILLADLGNLFNATRGTGSLGGIEITGKNLTVLNAGIAGDNFSTQPPGNITVTLSGTLTVGGTSADAFIHTISRGTAAAADLSITSKDILIADGGTISTETFRSGSGGQLNIFTDNLYLTNGGQVRSGSTIARPSRGQQPVIPSGTGGTITVQGLASPAESVLIDGAGSGILTDAQGTGAGGNINLMAQSVTLQNGGTLSASTSGTAPSATGGSITISAGQSVGLNNGASITASSTGPANAGNIAINAGATFLMENSSVTTQAEQAGGGDISVVAGDMVRLINSQLNTSVAGGAGGGGDISIDPNFVILQNSQILAQAFAGPGGNIAITTGTFLPDANSLVDASSQFGLSGTVTIQSPTSNLSAVWARLQQNYAEAAALLRARCAAQVSGAQSSFVLAGRDALPLEPGGWLPSPLALEGIAVAPPVAEEFTAPALATVGLRGFDQNISWSGFGKMPRRFASVLDTACGS